MAATMTPKATSPLMIRPVIVLRKSISSAPGVAKD
jgi:hypothetical protein